MERKRLKIFKDIPILKTKRLTLRKITPDDLYDVHEYASDPKVSHYLMWYPHKTPAYTKAYLKYICKLYKRGKFYDWGITIDGKLIGTVGFTSINRKADIAEIGYVLNSHFWRQGIATEAVREILRFGFEILELKKIEAVFLPENTGSRGVLIKCGLKAEACERSLLLIKEELREIEVFSITKEEYLSHK